MTSIARFDYNFRVMFARTCRVLSLLLLLLLAAASSRAFTGSSLSKFTYRSWHVQDGLPDQVVQAIAQTPDYFLWIGTTRGLLRFDGRTFVPYSGDGVDELRHGVTCLTVARDGSLYIGTEGGGVFRLHNGTMEQSGANEGIGNPLIRSILEDKTGVIWVGTDRGLFRQNGHRFERVEPVDEFSNLGSAAILQDRNGDVWSGEAICSGFIRIIYRTTPSRCRTAR